MGKSGEDLRRGSHVEVTDERLRRTAVSAHERGPSNSSYAYWRFSKERGPRMVATWCLALAALVSAGCASIRRYNSPEDRLQAAVETTRVAEPVNDFETPLA